MKKPTGLEAFATERGVSRRGPLCTTCALDPAILRQVEAGRAKADPIPFAMISAWLDARGIQVASITISRHFRGGHSRRTR